MVVIVLEESYNSLYSSITFISIHTLIRVLGRIRCDVLQFRGQSACPGAGSHSHAPFVYLPSHVPPQPTNRRPIPPSVLFIHRCAVCDGMATVAGESVLLVVDYVLSASTAAVARTHATPAVTHRIIIPPQVCTPLKPPSLRFIWSPSCCVRGMRARLMRLSCSWLRL